MDQGFAASHSAFGIHLRSSPTNEPVKDYAPGSTERANIQSALAAMANEVDDLPLFIGGRPVRKAKQTPVVMPHRHKHVLAQAHQSEPDDVQAAITACEAAAYDWSRTSAAERASIFLKAADLLAGPWRDRLNAATMLGQSKTVHQAEIDSAAELIDFLRFNVHFMERIYQDQPLSVGGVWNRVDYRPLEGFVFAITPFNFTAIAGNLPCAPALMGNTVLWKPAATAALSAHCIMKLLEAAGLPPGVINLVHGDAPTIAEIAFCDARLAGVHFTGSTSIFNSILRKVADARYRNYPRVVGETGGKNFVLAHASADLDSLATAIIRGAFEYQGQKCSAASRVFVPQSMWPSLKERLCDEIATIRMGDVAEFRNFMGAVIDLKAWTKHVAAMDEARSARGTTILTGGHGDKEVGYFIEPTLIETSDIQSRLLHEELFGPIVTVFVYADGRFSDIVETIDKTSRYGLTGSIFATERKTINEVGDRLRNAAGNFYINDKPTGAVVGQQPFGGARASGTNDKAGSMWNLIRWVSPRTIKETFVPAADYRYPFMSE
jgi:1-pyrroline-5-carboxylate dehydrogenase